MPSTGLSVTEDKEMSLVFWAVSLQVKGKIEAEAPTFWPPDTNNWLTGKDLDAGKDWGQEEKGTTEDEVVAWHHRLDRHEFEQALGAGDGPGSLASCSPWGHKESDTTDQLNWTELNWKGKMLERCLLIFFFYFDKLTSNGQMKLYIFKVYNMTICIHFEMVTIIKLINISIIPQGYLFKKI